MAQPLTTVAIGDVSFVDAFERRWQQDLIFSAVEDAQGRLWVGTLEEECDALKRERVNQTHYI